MNERTIRTAGIVVGVLIALPLALIVVLPLIVTFLGWLVAVPWAFLDEIVP